MHQFRVIFFSCLCLLLAACAQSDQDSSSQQEAEQPLTLETDIEKGSYALGMDIGKNITKGEMEIDNDILMRGLKDSLTGSEPALTQEEQTEALMALQQRFMEAQQEKTQEQAEANLEAGTSFMEEYSQDEDVQETDSGILYKVIEEGDGEKPGSEDRVTVHYTGKTVGGTVFDSSVERGEPATCPLNQVIPGWTEIRQLMPVGSKWEVVIPPEMAYGEQQAGPDIGPGSTLIFEIELLETMKPQQSDEDTAETPQETEDQQAQ